jgi:ribosomal protein L20
LDLAEIIEQQAAGIAKAIKMPHAEVTSYEREQKKNRKRKLFATRVFAIIDDISAEEYSEFINQVIMSDGEIEIVREVENWTKDGELIRVVDYVTNEPNED